MKILSLTTMIALATALNAAQMDNIYIGVDIGQSSIKTNSDSTVELLEEPFTKASNGSDNTQSGFSQTLKLGYMFNANNRALVFFQNNDVEDTKASTFGVGYDYLIGENSLQPFVGLFVGSTSMSNSKNGLDATSTSYGAQIGLSYSLNSAISLEGGYRFTKLDMQESLVSNDTVYGKSATLKESVEVDALTNLFVGMNYKF